MSFGGTQEPAAYGELVSIGGLNPDVNKKLSAAIAAILETKLSVPKSRFFLKFYDTKASYLIINHRPSVGSLNFVGFLIALLLVLGTSSSRLCTVFACFTSAIEHVNNHLPVIILSSSLFSDLCLIDFKFSSVS
ncbi:L-dopachrome isomerase protein [Dioscorea alata]|uniref:L-dopachrome isomerase protein n=1 Tax=Dioscorea alata TaxID=55571 RepID=A0ACB7VTC8_DIOAL|nr:L-dopachrome isomerase protein [Dioscorea alata]